MAILLYLRYRAVIHLTVTNATWPIVVVVVVAVVAVVVDAAVAAVVDFYFRN